MFVFLITLMFTLLCPSFSIFGFSAEDDDDDAGKQLLCGTEFNCNCLDTKIDCGHLKIQNFKDKLEFSQKILVVNFQGNEIESLQKYFARGKSVRKLDLSYNNIKFVSSEAFSKLNNLTSLDLSHNRVWSLAVDVFSGVQSLRKLDLSYNNIQNYFPEVFKPTKMLTILSLEFNPLSFFDSGAFQYLTKLENLNLRYTGISSLPDKLFTSNSQLKYLSLANNVLSSVPSIALKSLGSLLVLDLSDNPIELIKSGDFKGLSNLTTLYISKMRELKKIEKFAFEGLINLRVLHCSHNDHLEEVDSMAFATNKTFPLKHIEMLYLRSNSLKTLSEKLVNWMQLEYVDLSGNPWHCNCLIQWLSKIHWKHELQFNIRCATPSYLAGRVIASISVDDFKCETHMSVQLIVTLTLFTVTAFIGILLTIVLFLYRRGRCFSCSSQLQTRYHKVFQRKDEDIEYDPKE